MGVATAQHGAEAATGAEELVVTDLLLDLDELRAHLEGRLRARDATDAFLLAAGINQILEDHLHRDPLSLAKVEHLLSGAGALRTVLARAVAAARRALLAGRRLSPGEHRLRHRQQEVAALVDALAGGLVGATPSWPALEREWSKIDGGLRAAPRLRSSVLRLPSCFRDLDQRPEDIQRLGVLVASEVRPEQPLLVVGLRTSGSYLAPLLASTLRAQGRSAVSRTLRPGAELSRRERHELRRLAGTGFCAVLVDDPPSSGRALARGARALERAGFGRADIVIAVAALDAALPPELAARRCVLLRFEQWAIHRALDEEAVHAALAELLPGQCLDVARGSARILALLGAVRLTRQPPLGRGEHRPRRHSEGLYDVSVLTTDGPRRLMVHASGVGLGYLGRQSPAIATALGPWLPRQFGVSGGLIFREWVEHAPSLQPYDQDRTERLATAIAAYVGRRAAVLPAARDRSLQLGGRNPVWQRVADVLAERYARLRPVARWPLHRLARRLLRAEAAAVIDGDVAPARWFLAARPDGGARDVKIAADGAAYSNEDLACYDPVFDLAAAAASLRVELKGEPPPTGLREAAGTTTEERWLLYQLERLSAARRDLGERWADGGCPEVEAALRGAAIDAARERVHAEYLAATVGRVPPLRAPRGLCAVDIDGVLESGRFGYSATTPLGLAALAALAAHGYAPVLATGRHLPDVRWRCATYGLPAAVAEYGCVVYVAEGARVVDVVDAEQRRLMAEVARRLRSGGMLLDPDFRCAIRAYRLDARGGRRSPEGATVAALLGDLAPSVAVIGGWAQVDVVPRGVDKAAGLAALRLLLGGSPAEGELAMAIGDSGCDLPMLRMARLGCAPRNAATELREAGIRVLRQAEQRGLAGAVSLLLGHRPGGCRRCASRPVARESNLLLQVLGASDLAPHRRSLSLLRLLWEAGG